MTICRNKTKWRIRVMGRLYADHRGERAERELQWQEPFEFLIQ